MLCSQPQSDAQPSGVAASQVLFLVFGLIITFCCLLFAALTWVNFTNNSFMSEPPPLPLLHLILMQLS